MAPVMNLIVYASFLLIVVNGQDNVSEQLREIKDTLRQRDALYQQQHNYISGTMERYLARQVERRIDFLDQQQTNHSSLMDRYVTMMEDGKLL